MIYSVDFKRVTSAGFYNDVTQTSERNVVQLMDEK